MFIGLLTSIVNTSKHTKCVFLGNRKCATHPTLIKLHPNEHNQGLCYYPFPVNLAICSESRHTYNSLSNKLCVPNKTKDWNLSAFNMITGINKFFAFTCECKCKFHRRECNSNQKWNNNKCWSKCKNPKKDHACEKDYIWNSATRSCKNGKYWAIIIDNSAITCDVIIEVTTTVPTGTVSTKGTSTSFYVLLAFLLITIALLIAVSICCYLIKYKAK